MMQKVQRLEESMDQVFAKFEDWEHNDQGRVHLDSLNSPPVPVATTSNPSTRNSASPLPPPQKWQIILDPQGGPASIPASCVSEVTNSTSLGNMSSSDHSDLISKGIISLDAALTLFDIYHLRLDHFLYKVLGDLTTLDSIRRCSPILTAAVCTVGALHSQTSGNLFERCYHEYKTLITQSTFSTTLNADDIRGLCIGAFWLHELSWALIGAGRFFFWA